MGQDASGAGRSFLITGGSGALASAVAEALLRQGERVVVASRSPADVRVRRLTERGASAVRLDPSDAAQVRKLPPAQVLVHLAEAHDSSLGRSGLWAANVGGVCNLLDWARRTGVGRLILRGAAAVAGQVDSPGALLDENQPAQPADLYLRSKLTAERMALQWSQKHRIPLAVARLARVYGGGTTYEPLERAIRFVLTGVLREQPDTRLLHPVHIEDAASALVLLACDSRLISRVYNVSGARPFSERELFHKLATLAGRESLAERVPPIPPVHGEKLHEGWSHDRLARELGWRPRAAFARDLIDTLVAATKAREAARAAAVGTSASGVFQRFREVVFGAA